MGWCSTRTLAHACGATLCIVVQYSVVRGVDFVRIFASTACTFVDLDQSTPIHDVTSNCCSIPGIAEKLRVGAKCLFSQQY